MEILSRCKPAKNKGWVALRNGHLIPQHILDRIIDAAKRGKITAAGKKLMLVPDTRHGPADASGYREMGRVRKSDCIALTSLCPLGKRTKPTPSVADRKTEDPEKLDIKATVGAASRARKSHSGATPLDHGEGGAS